MNYTKISCIIMNNRGGVINGKKINPVTKDTHITIITGIYFFIIRLSVF